MLERELGPVAKMYRGHGEHEKPWIAAVESFAIGGACQWLLVMDRVIAGTGSYFNLPARKEGIIPGCANLRLPRFVGERMSRQAIFFGRTFHADTPEGRLIADDVVAAEDVEPAIERAAAKLMSAGRTSLVANRRALRAAHEPLDGFRRYISTYAREQARCLYSPALIDNLERHWVSAASTGARQPRTPSVARTTCCLGALQPGDVTPLGTPGLAFAWPQHRATAPSRCWWSSGVQRRTARS
jgi:thioesterase DpgC